MIKNVENLIKISKKCLKVFTKLFSKSKNTIKNTKNKKELQMKNNLRLMYKFN